jgi:hypothetical protein
MVSRILLMCDVNAEDIDLLLTYWSQQSSLLELS